MAEGFFADVGRADDQGVQQTEFLGRIHLQQNALGNLKPGEGVESSPAVPVPLPAKKVPFLRKPGAAAAAAADDDYGDLFGEYSVNDSDEDLQQQRPARGHGTAADQDERTECGQDSACTAEGAVPSTDSPDADADMAEAPAAEASDSAAERSEQQVKTPLATISGVPDMLPPRRLRGQLAQQQQRHEASSTQALLEVSKQAAPGQDGADSRAADTRMPDIAATEVQEEPQCIAPDAGEHKAEDAARKPVIPPTMQLEDIPEDPEEPDIPPTMQLEEQEQAEVADEQVAAAPGKADSPVCDTAAAAAAAQLPCPDQDMPDAAVEEPGSGADMAVQDEAGKQDVQQAAGQAGSGAVQAVAGQEDSAEQSSADKPSEEDSSPAEHMQVEPPAPQDTPAGQGLPAQQQQQEQPEQQNTSGPDEQTPAEEEAPAKAGPADLAEASTPVAQQPPSQPRAPAPDSQEPTNLKRISSSLTFPALPRPKGLSTPVISPPQQKPQPLAKAPAASTAAQQKMPLPGPLQPPFRPGSSAAHRAAPQQAVPKEAAPAPMPVNLLQPMLLISETPGQPKSVQPQQRGQLPQHSRPSMAAAAGPALASTQPVPKAAAPAKQTAAVPVAKAGAPGKGGAAAQSLAAQQGSQNKQPQSMRNSGLLPLMSAAVPADNTPASGSIVGAGRGSSTSGGGKAAPCSAGPAQTSKAMQKKAPASSNVPPKAPAKVPSLQQQQKSSAAAPGRSRPPATSQVLRQQDAIMHQEKPKPHDAMGPAADAAPSSAPQQHPAAGSGPVHPPPAAQEAAAEEPADDRSIMAKLHSGSRELDLLMLQTQGMMDEALELKVQAAIAANRLIRLDNPIMHAKLASLKTEMEELMRTEE